jgi:outer membrane receptor protein involved in Fe transport
VDVNLGTRISFEPLSIGFSAGYAYTKDDMIQVMEQKGGFVYSNFAQDNTHHVFAALNLGYDLRGWLKLSADARYNYWDCKENTLLIMKPEVAVNLNAEARIIEDLTLRVGYNYTLYTKTDNGRMTDKHDLHARVSYQINKRFGAYIQGSNLLNCKYYEYAGYMTRGARGSLGATMNF